MLVFLGMFKKTLVAFCKTNPQFNIFCEIAKKIMDPTSNEVIEILIKLLEINSRKM